MKIRVDRELCEGNSVCVALAPALFDLDDDNMAVPMVENPAAEAMAEAERAANGCPREAIALDG
ncbi:ferredoxin [Streptomyces sp. NPDC059517]|uniref:ferredoxin n=1 Tax=Streptomyces sp. NPDC059517 TaxID=3346855 RepID=UPI003685BEF9